MQTLAERQDEMRERWTRADQSERFIGATMLQKRWAREDYQQWLSSQSTATSEN